MDLAHTDNARRWERMLDHVKGHVDSGLFSQFENEFVKSMVHHNEFDRPIWNPTVKQFNFLHQLAGSVV